MTFDGKGASERTAGMSVGPILISRGADDAFHSIVAILVRPAHAEAVPLILSGRTRIEPELLTELFGSKVWRYAFSVPTREAIGYSLDGKDFRIAPCGAGDLRIAYVSCNGEENGDLDRPLEERDVMWNRLAGQHRHHPFGLILEGGDQIYADDVLESHPEVIAWEEASDAEGAVMPLSQAARDAVRFFYFNRYCITYARPAMAALSAEAPAAMMWDDHDIIDGWGSLADEVLDSPIGRGVFEAAREMFRIFQIGVGEGPLPDSFHDATGETFTYSLDFPGFRLVVPDLRSERRRHRVMGPKGWHGFETAMSTAPADTRILLMSSVPVMGPRLSWLEFVSDYVPPARDYEDDLRDQWQSRSHRKEWKRFLKVLAEAQEHKPNRVTILSGEIHLATRGQMSLRDKTSIHQLVSSGISHRSPPRAYALVLTMLARLGESPLPRRKIKMHRMPSAKTIYVEERNYMVLRRDGRDWSAVWELEEQGRTSALQLQ
ncbi:alkaline phosphatase D family protein [Fulvimarina sp. 2208YS6-2-32]|uniref:Alkaline phosphatase D family protein n=1 Tax=Fulvimarina uroteuthidis TaxID=3098149 RepID=A0ABU5I3H0_9HYPH|nr:alkaline phosphatase D family protein [Fulvimarina sp. 2208YS6-2-32]MDY8109920.1 alkaline phosphatase D family protein [Fulvimarina sp. 2208YS6-2-32]